MRPFTLERPATLAQAVEALRRAPETARPVSGGTALVPLWKQGIVSPATVVDLAGIAELHQRAITGDAIVLGAMTRLAELEDWAEFRDAAPLLHAACRRTANRRVREMATIGGSLAHGESASDVNAAALASDVDVHLLGPTGARVVPIGSFFRGLYETALGADEILTHISCRAFPRERRSAYVKFCPRSRYDKPALAVAVAVTRAASGVYADVRIALGNVVERPVRALEAEPVLEGARPREGLWDDAAAAAARELDPIGDLQGSSEYKRAMVRVWVRRALEQAHDGAGAGAEEAVWTRA